ncbi:unnamed protein product, partial [Candidula unifasciata]
MKSQKTKTGRKRNASPRQSEPVEVYCRIRPLDDPNEPGCVNAIGDTVVQLLPPENAVGKNGQLKEYQFTFQHVFDEFASQKTVFDYIALPLVEDLVAGKNGLLFTYGITGSGKTYTMTGRPEDQGILPRCLDVIFNSIGQQQASKYVFRPDRLNGFEVQSEADAMLERQKRDIMPNLTTPSKTSLKKMDSCDTERITDVTKVDTVEEDNNYAVFVSYIEIYNNYVYDLLEELPYNAITGYKPPQTKLLRTNASDNMYVHNCTEVEVKQPQEAIDVFYKGQRRRKVAHTTLNAESSRSHSVFNIRLVQAPLDDRGEQVVQDPSRLCVSQLSLVDLAGSERTNRTKNSGDRLKEAGNINQSLLVLRTCLEILRENQKTGANKLVPYRDSKLTHLFKNFFDGDGKVRMIVCVNPKVADYEETIHVMKFAELTQEVVTAKSEEMSKFDIGMTPGRRRMHQEQLDKMEPIGVPIFPAVEFTVGPPFPLLELLNPTDDMTIRNIVLCLTERMKRKREMAVDYERSCTSFRSQLLELEQNYIQARNRLQEVEERSALKEKEAARLDSKNKSLEKKLEERDRLLKDLEKENQLLSLQVQDKAWKIQVERNAREKLRSDCQNRIQMNNQAWEKNLEKARRKFEVEAECKLDERDRKLEMLRDIVNENECATPLLRSRGHPQPTPKPRTYTTPAALPSARSESDMTSVGSSTIASSARAATGRIGNTRVQSRNTVRIPAAKSITNLDLAGVTPSISKS